MPGRCLRLRRKGRRTMNRKLRHFAVFALLLGVVAVAGATAARGGDSREVNLRDEAVLQGKTIPSGTYTLGFQESGERVDVTLRSGKKTLATAAARRVSLERASEFDGIAFRTGENGSREIVRILFAGKKEALEI